MSGYVPLLPDHFRAHRFDSVVPACITSVDSSGDRNVSDTVCLGDNSLAYTKSEIIGRGSFGLVWKAFRKCTPEEIFPVQTFAVKEIHLDSGEMERLQSDSDGKAVFQRWKSLFELKHPNVLRYYQIKIERSPFGGTVYLAMEFMADGDLGGLITQIRKKEMTLTPNMLLHMTEQLMYGLDYLHQINIIHGDLKPGNVLLKPCPRKQWTLIIGDLDDRIQMEENVTQSWDIPHLYGTARYMSPEMVSKFVRQGVEKPGRKTDIWSLGCIILDLADSLYGFGLRRSFSKKRLFSRDSFIISADTTREQIIFKIANGYTPVISPEIPSDLADVIRRCLVANAAERASADALLIKVRSLLYEAVDTNSSALFHRTYAPEKYNDAWRFNLHLVWTWVPNSDTRAIAEGSDAQKTSMTGMLENSEPDTREEPSVEICSNRTRRESVLCCAPSLGAVVGKGDNNTITSQVKHDYEIDDFLLFAGIGFWPNT